MKSLAGYIPTRYLYQVTGTGTIELYEYSRSSSVYESINNITRYRYRASF